MAIGDSTKLQISGTVQPLLHQNVQYIPANGEKIVVGKFSGTPSGSENASVRLIWDYDGANELLWNLGPGVDKMPFEIFFEKTGDGSKILAIQLYNNCVNPYDMSGFCLIQVVP